MRIVVVDGQGGGLGKAVVEQVIREFPGAEVIAAGANAVATAAMLRAGASAAATGENAVVYNCRRADVIIGALGIGFANAMHGEISPAMAAAVSMSDAHKILVPVSRCNVTVVGVVDKPMAQLVSDVIDTLRAL